MKYKLAVRYTTTNPDEAPDAVIQADDVPRVEELLVIHGVRYQVKCVTRYTHHTQCSHLALGTYVDITVQKERDQ